MKRYAGVLATCLLVVIVSGAVKAPWHAAAGVVAGLLSIGLVRFGVAGYIGLAAMALEFVPAHPILHAVLAPVIVAAMAFLLTQPRDSPASGGGMIGLGVSAPLLVFAQIAMGAAYRHKLWSVMPHMAGAALAVSVTLTLSVLAIQRGPELRAAATATLAAVLTQASLGIAALILRLLDLDEGLWFQAVSAAHITVAAVTLGATVSLGRLVIGNPAPHRQNAGPQNQ